MNLHAVMHDVVSKEEWSEATTKIVVSQLALILALMKKGVICEEDLAEAKQEALKLTESQSDAPDASGTRD